MEERSSYRYLSVFLLDALAKLPFALAGGSLREESPPGSPDIYGGRGMLVIVPSPWETNLRKTIVVVVSPVVQRDVPNEQRNLEERGKKERESFFLVNLCALD